MSDLPKLPGQAPEPSTDLELRRESYALAEYGTPPIPLVVDDYDLVPLLREASNEELAPLVEYIIQKGGLSAELPHTHRYLQHAPNHRMYADDIAAEIQKFGANSIASFFRDGRGLPYREILFKASKKAGIRVRVRDDVEDVELRLLETVLGRAWQKMTPNERQELLRSIQVDSLPGAKAAGGTITLQGAIHAGGFAPYKLSVIVANGLAQSLLGHGFSFAANAALTKGISIFAGPIGWAFSALWLTTLATGPAYRVVMPCIVQVAMIRQAALLRERAARRSEWLLYVFMVLAALALVIVGTLIVKMNE